MMKIVEEKIRKEGKVVSESSLKVDSFLNHQLDVAFLSELGKEFYRLYAKSDVNKILTIESNGIGLACMTAQAFGCSAVFAKRTRNASHDKFWVSKVHSYSRNTDHHFGVIKEYLKEGDRVLIVDDVLAHGSALEAMIDICQQAGATVVGAGIVIEMAFREGGKQIRGKGVRVESLARVVSMKPDGEIKFC